MILFLIDAEINKVPVTFYELSEILNKKRTFNPRVFSEVLLILGVCFTCLWGKEMGFQPFHRPLRDAYLSVKL